MWSCFENPACDWYHAQRASELAVERNPVAEGEAMTQQAIDSTTRLLKITAGNLKNPAKKPVRPKTKSSLLAFLAQQGAEAGLHEMMVRRQGFFHPTLFHHHERKAIDQRPVFIRSAGEQVEPGVKELLRGR